MDDKITIIEGPPPTFDPVGDSWALGLNESPSLSSIVLTRLRTHNGEALVERCNRAWRHKHTMHLEYRGVDGLENQAPILAVRTLQGHEGQVLYLWLRLEQDPDELNVDFDDDSRTGFDNDP